MITVYKASAGSGKTFNLVKEYLKFLLGKKNEDGTYSLDRHLKEKHGQILAITFTNKATEEMKKRIIDELDTLSFHTPESPYAADLCKTFAVDEKALQKASQTALKQLLHDYGNFNISTIDAFFQLILRTFAYEVELSGNYNVELNDDYAIAVGISNLKQQLHESGSSPESRMLRQWLIDFMKARIDEGKSWDIFRMPTGQTSGSDIYSFARDLSKEAVKRNIDKLAEYLKDNGKITRFKESLQESLRKSRGKISDACALFRSVTAEYRPEDFNRKFNEKFQGEPDAKTIEQICKAEGKPDKWFKKKPLATASADVIDGINRSIKQLREASDEMSSAKMILSNLYFLGLLGDISANILDFTKENNLIMLSDTNEMLKKIINKDDAPFIYERVGIRLKNFLIDEFQDTSKMQWENLEPLVANSLAEGNDNLIIGDVKQSIYRFRNSDPTILKDDIYRTFGRQITDIGTSLKENTNWRSASNIVRWNNTLFTLLAKRLGMDDIYSNVVQQVAPRNAGNPGHVRIEWVESGEDNGYTAVVLDRMIADIRDALSRGYQQRDIAILVNKRAEGQSVIARILDDGRGRPDGERINVVSEESLIIRKSPAVKTIMAILATLDSQSNYRQDGGENGRKKSLAVIIKQFESNLSNGKNVTEALTEAVGSDDRIDRGALLGNNAATSLNAIIDRIVETHLTKEMADSQTPFIQALQDLVTDFEERYGSDLHQFLKYWESTGKNTTISSPDNIQAVNVMTIHKSKGLEFPCVIIPFCNWDLEKSSQMEWVESERIRLEGVPEDCIPPIMPVVRSKKTADTIFRDVFAEMSHANILDSLNKTYVAFTRAGEELIAYIPEDPKKQGEIGGYIMEIAASGQRAIDEACNLPGDGIAEQLLAPADYFDGGILEIGEPQPPFKRHKEDGGTTKKEMPGYHITARPEIWKFDVPDTVAESHDSPKYKGTVMHRIMCRIRHGKDADKAIRQFLTKGIITPLEAEEYGEIIRRGLENPEAAEWFAEGNRIISERAVADGKGNTYRPDRIVATPDGRTIVIDYKFGEKEDKRYLRQVANYMRLIEACGFPAAEGYVWYVPENIIRKV